MRNIIYSEYLPGLLVLYARLKYIHTTVLLFCCCRFFFPTYTTIIKFSIIITSSSSVDYYCHCWPLFYIIVLYYYTHLLFIMCITTSARLHQHIIIWDDDEKIMVVTSNLNWRKRLLLYYYLSHYDIRTTWCIFTRIRTHTHGRRMRGKTKIYQCACVWYFAFFGWSWWGHYPHHEQSVGTMCVRKTRGRIGIVRKHA